MSIGTGLALIYRRDLTRLLQQVEAFPDNNSLWKTLPGVTNCAGNLVLHLEGNLREFVGRQLGGQDYQRQRPLEFSRWHFRKRLIAACALRANAGAVEGFGIGRGFPNSWANLFALDSSALSAPL